MARRQILHIGPDARFAKREIRSFRAVNGHCAPGFRRSLVLVACRGARFGAVASLRLAFEGRISPPVRFPTLQGAKPEREALEATGLRPLVWISPLRLASNRRVGQSYSKSGESRRRSGVDPHAKRFITYGRQGGLARFFPLCCAVATAGPNAPQFGYWSLTLMVLWHRDQARGRRAPASWSTDMPYGNDQ